MRFLLLVLIPSLAFADRVLPTPPPGTAQKEKPCSGAKGGKLLGRYTCQLGIDGVFGEVVPCEIVDAPKPREYDGYLRFKKWIDCDIVGQVTGTKLDGSVSCIPREDNQIGHEALIEGTLATVAGGYRMVQKAEMYKEYGWGPADARKTTTTKKLQTFTLNVCRSR